MRVIHLAGYAAPYGGGFIPMMRAAAEAVECRGRFELVLPRAAAERPWFGRLRSAGVEVTCAPPGGRVASARWLRARVGDEPTILHSHFAVFDLPATAAALGRPDARAVWHLHTLPNPPLAVRLRNRLSFGVAGRATDAILCVSRDGVDGFVARGAPASRTRFFANGVDTGALPLASADQRVAARRRLGIPAERPAVLHFSRDWWIKGGDLFMAAVRHLHDEGRTDVLAICSQGGADARAAAERLGLEESVCMVPAVDDVRDLYAAADVVVVSSRSEGMPFGILEALSTGTAVVVSEVLRGPQDVGDDVPGYRRVPPAPGAFARGIGELLGRDPSTVAAESQAARHAVAERWDLATWTRHLLALYDELFD